MNSLACEAIRKAAPELRVLVRKAAELETQDWIAANLPPAVGLPKPAVMAAQVVGLREAVFAVFQRQRRRYSQYVSEHPPALLPVAGSALRDLPLRAALTYHSWLQGVALRQEWAYDPERGIELDRRELEEVLRQYLREAVGSGGVAGLKSAGGLPPGLAFLSQKEAGALRRRLAGLAGSRDAGARALCRAVSDRAAGAAVRGVVLRDGAGRPVAAATYTARGTGDLAVRYLGAFETAAAGSGVQMVRELAGLAALEGRGLVLFTVPESEAVFAGLGFSPGPGGRFALSAKSARKLAQTPPGSSSSWTRAGWLEGPETFLSVGEAADAHEVRKAGAGIPEELGGLRFGSGEVVVRDAAGELLAVATYELPEEAGDLVLVSLWVSPKAPRPTGRRLVRELAAAAARHGRGMVARPAADVVDLYERLGMAKPGKAYSFTPKETAAFASGLTQTATFAGQLSWELAVAGATEYLERDVIPGVVDSVTATTHRQLVDTLIQGLDRGEGTGDLIARIRALDDTTFGLARAERIARTEVITANRAGAHQIAVDAGATTKQWVSRLMPNTRAWHREAHGQVVPIADPFVVSNRKGEPEELMFPGDRSRGAGPDNVIQCVCGSRSSKPGVSDEAAYDEHGLAGPHPAPGPVVAAMPEPVRKGRSSLEDLRAFVLKHKGWVPGPNAYWRRISPDQQTLFGEETVPRIAEVPEPPTAPEETVIEWGDPDYPRARLVVDPDVPDEARAAVEAGWRKAMERKPRNVTVRLVEGLCEPSESIREEDLVKIPAEYRSREDDIRVFAGTYEWVSANLEYQRYTPGPHHILGRVPPPSNMSLIYEDLWEGMLVHEMGHDACDELLGDNMHVTLNRMITEAAGGRSELSEALEKIRENISCYSVHSGSECYAECYTLRHSDAWKAGRVPARVRRFVEALLAGKLTADEIDALPTKYGG